VDNSKHNPGNAILRNGVLYTADRGGGALVDANTQIGVPGWHSRGYLPHFESPEATQHVTFHLADSLPKEVLLRLDAELKTHPEEKRDAERRKRVEAWIDAGHGSCILRNPAIAKMVQGSLLSFDAQRYRLLAWVVMPNHVHALFHPMNGWTIAKIVASWKKFTASKIWDHHRLTGEGPSPPIWHREYWDRYIRDQRHFEQAIEYIHLNPVKAGLVATPESWPWSSAHPGNANLRIGEQQNAIVENGVPRSGKP
jgi:REP element-mobilizing transposase RayT